MNWKNWEKFWDFYFNSFFFKSLFWTNISYFSMNQPKKWIIGGKNEKNYSNLKNPWNMKILGKIRIDIKMGNHWPYKNHHYRSKYLTFLYFVLYCVLWKNTVCSTEIEKNPKICFYQKIHNFYAIITKLGKNILTKFRNDCVKIVDFLIKAYFWGFLKFGVPCCR